jgi:hypothetical protein
MAQAAQSISKTSKIIHILRGHGDELATMTRWLARKEIKAEWKRMGRQISLVDENALASATTHYVIEHRTRLRTEAQLILSSTSSE